jgi:hypothetical protein
LVSGMEGTLGPAIRSTANSADEHQVLTTITPTAGGFWEPRYTVRILAPGKYHQGRPFLRLCPTARKREQATAS